MPIKFRCDKCRQFLGISRSLAGQVVDCPTCGRSTRVPNLDGTRAPIPARPQIDGADSSLLDALNQLADLGKPVTKEKNGKTASQVAPASNGDLSKAAATAGKQTTASSSDANSRPPAAIPTEPVAKARVIDPPPTQTPASQGSVTEAITPRGELNTAVVLEALAAQAEPTTAAPARRTRSSLGLWLTMIAVGATLFAGGLFIGRRGTNSVTETMPPNDLKAEPAKPPTVKPMNGLTGRITYRKPGTECLVDRGARVFVWPADQAPEQPWSADDFRGSGESVPPGATKLRDIGGGMVLVRPDGTFNIELPNGGDYEILISSRYAGRSVFSKDLPEADLARIRKCFAEPQRLLGKTQYRLLRAKYRGEGSHLVDCVFEVGE